MKKNKPKEKITDMLLEVVDSAVEILTLQSLQRICYGEYYEAVAKEQRRQSEKRKIQRGVHYLKKAGYISMNQKHEIKLSEKGKIKLLLHKANKFKPSKKRKKEFYLVIFDIPETMKNMRNLLRRFLYNFGSDNLQKSVFIIKDKEAYIYIKELVQMSDLSEYVKLIRCNKID